MNRVPSEYSSGKNNKLSLPLSYILSCDGLWWYFPWTWNTITWQPPKVKLTTYFWIWATCMWYIIAIERHHVCKEICGTITIWKKVNKSSRISYTFCLTVWVVGTIQSWIKNVVNQNVVYSWNTSIFWWLVQIFLYKLPDNNFDISLLTLFLFMPHLICHNIDIQFVLMVFFSFTPFFLWQLQCSVGIP